MSWPPLLGPLRLRTSESAGWKVRNEAFSDEGLGRNKDLLLRFKCWKRTGRFRPAPVALAAPLTGLVGWKDDDPLSVSPRVEADASIFLRHTPIADRHVRLLFRGELDHRNQALDAIHEASYRILCHTPCWVVGGELLSRRSQCSREVTQGRADRLSQHFDVMATRTWISSCTDHAVKFVRQAANGLSLNHNRESIDNSHCVILIAPGRGQRLLLFQPPEKRYRRLAKSPRYSARSPRRRRPHPACWRTCRG